MKSIGKKFSYEIFKMYLQKLGRLENGSVSKLVSHGFHSLKEIHDKTKMPSSLTIKEIIILDHVYQVYRDYLLM